jgi:GTP-binding protein EngB required for normal cell division
MCTLIKKQRPNLEYLEEVRKHLSRLPSIDPTTRTLIVTGYPNVGKSTFMNEVSRADVDVQPYAFTTKSLFVGHFDYDYFRWQVLDTPGILDHPLEERNTIEMQAITALAHLHASILFFIDISEQCGFTIEQQARLFENIRPLFTDRPLMVIATKTDAQPWETLDAYSKARIEGLVKDSGAHFQTMSCFTKDGVMAVRNKACDVLKAVRVSQKMQQRGKVAKVLNRLTVTTPKPRDGRTRGVIIPAAVAAVKAVKAAALTTDKKGRKTYSGVLTVQGGDDSDDDDLTYSSSAMAAAPGGTIVAGGALPSATAEGLRNGLHMMPGPAITGDVIVARSGAKKAGAVQVISAAEAARAGASVPEGAVVVSGSGPGGRVLEKDREAALGGTGVYRADDTKEYILANTEWRDDITPQFMDGKNVFDFIDPDILARMQAMEAEQDALDAAWEAEAATGMYAPDAPDRVHQQAMAHAVRSRRMGLREAQGREKGQNKGSLPRAYTGTATAKSLKDRLIRKGLPEDRATAIAAQAAEAPTRGRKRSRSLGRDHAEAAAAKAQSGDGDADLTEDGKRRRGRSGTAREGGAIVGRSRSTHRSKSVTARTRAADLSTNQPSDGFSTLKQKKAAIKLGKVFQRPRNSVGRKGEGDHLVGDEMPKHLFSGKRRQGTNDWR